MSKAQGVMLALAGAGLLAVPCGWAQSTAAPQAAPIAIVPLDANAKPGEAVTVAGALEVTGGRAMMAASGSITAGAKTARVILPRRGELRVCARTTVKLAADMKVPSGGVPGLLLAIDHGAMEMSLAGSNAAQNSDVLLTPDFRILVSGPGATELKVRLGEGGDTCVENAGVNAPYVLVSSVFEGGAYRVMAGQRVAFQRGNLHEIVDQEKESCGCPPETHGPNEFPLAQSEGLEPLATPAPSRNGTLAGEPLVRTGADRMQEPKPAADAEQGTASAAAPAKSQKRPGFLARVGMFFRKLLGAE